MGREGVVSQVITALPNVGNSYLKTDIEKNGLSQVSTKTHHARRGGALWARITKKTD